MITNKNIAVTGHTKKGSLGYSIYNYFSHNNNVLGFSRSTGYNILYDCDHIISESCECEIFINCVAANTEINGQEELAKKWYETHKDKQHLLVNVSCLLPWLQFVMNFKNKETGLPFSSEDKLSLNKISFEINNKGNIAKSIDIAPGMLEFNLINLEYLEKIRISNAEVKHTAVIDAIEFAIMQYYRGTLIPYIAISNTPYNYKGN